MFHSAVFMENLWLGMCVPYLVAFLSLQLYACFTGDKLRGGITLLTNWLS